MRVVFEVDEALTVGGYIEDVPHPTQIQAVALRDLAVEVGRRRDALLGRADETG